VKFLINLAAKNLFRNKLRSSISILAIALSVALVVFAKGIVVGFVDNMFSLHIQYQAGHIRIINQEYEQKERLLSLNHPVDGFQGAGLSRMKEKLIEVQGVEQVMPRIRFGAAVSHEDEMVRMMGWGVNPEQEVEFTDIEQKLAAGRMVQPGQREVVMGADLLAKLDLEVGEKTTFLYQTSFGSFKGSTFQVVGKISSGLKLLDDKVFYLPLGQAQRILEMPDMATEVLLATADYKNIDPVVPRVKNLFKSEGATDKYVISPWNEGSSLISMLQIAKNIYNVVYIFLVVLGAFVVVNTMIMIVKERTEEIGMMTALGLKSKEVLYMFIMEGTAIGIIGSFLGVVLGAAANKAAAVTGIIDYSAALEGVNANIMMNSVIRPEVSLEALVYSFLLGVIVTTLTCIIPARKAAKLEPADALRVE